jgi:hypothetical protein
VTGTVPAVSEDAITIVLADDHPVVRSGLKMLLEAQADLEVVAEAGDVDATRRSVLGYRLEAGAGSLCYLPDHEPGLGQDLDKARPAWISGHALASRASLLIHDC